MRHKRMKTIDLTTKTAAREYLRSLAPNVPVSIPDRFDRMPHEPAVDAVAVLIDCPLSEWASANSRWVWTAGELVNELCPDGCTCHLDQPWDSPVPNFCPVHDGDYSSWLVSNNID